MGITGDHYRGEYQGHSIELVRDNWAKTLALIIDGQKVAAESRALPHDITLSGALLHDGVEHRVVARSVVHFPATDDRIEVDGEPIRLDKVK